MDDYDPSITAALEQFALSLSRSSAVPIVDLVRALERTAEGLRTGMRAAPQATPGDLIPQAEAARLAGVSRQAVHQWVSRGTLRTYPGRNGTGRGTSLVSRADVIVAANRGSEVPFSATLRGQLTVFAALIEPAVAPEADDGLIATLKRLSESSAVDVCSPAAATVLREFVIAAMGTSSMQQEFTPGGVHMLASLKPKIIVDPRTPFGSLADTLGLLVHSARGQAGFDSASAAVLALLGCATIGAAQEDGNAGPGRQIAGAAEQVWGEGTWIGRLHDLAFHLEEMSPVPMTRYTASMTYLATNRFLRQAQSAGVSITYARSPGVLRPESYYGDAILADILAGRRAPSKWGYDPRSAALAKATMARSEGNPFRWFSFESGLLEPNIHGVRRYCFSTEDARSGMRRTIESLPASQRNTYIDTAIGLLTRTLAQPYMEVTAVDKARDFDWWKDHIIRSSQREIMLGMRNPRARNVAHALLVQTSMLPDVIEAADTDNSLRDRLRIYVKNLEFDLIDERYTDDLRRGVARMIKSAGETLSPAASHVRAEAEITALLARNTAVTAGLRTRRDPA